MSKKTISTPELFGSSGDRSSRGVSEVVGTASLIVLALGLVGGLAAGLGGVTDGINNNGLDGDIGFAQDGTEVTATVNSVSDDVEEIRFSTDNSGGESFDASAFGDVSSDTDDPTVGTVSTDSGTSYNEGDTITVTAFDGNGNQQVIAQYVVESTST